MKIKITKDTREIEGTVEEKKVTPFGTSAHIAVGKTHRGKYVDVVVPTEPDYFWVLSDSELKEVVVVCNKILDKEDSKLRFHKAEAVSNITKMKFTIDDLNVVYALLKKSKRHNHIVKKLKDNYSL